MFTGGYQYNMQSDGALVRWASASKARTDSVHSNCACRVLLLKSEKHTERLVVKAILDAIPGTSEDHALNCFNTAEKLGQAMITSCIKGVRSAPAALLFQGIPACAAWHP